MRSIAAAICGSRKASTPAPSEDWSSARATRSAWASSASARRLTTSSAPGAAEAVSAQQRKGGGQPGDGVPIDAADEHPRREDAQDRVGGAALEREPAAEQPGPRPVAAVAQPAVLVGWRAGEELLELGRAGSWVVAQPMPPPGRQHDEVSGGEWDLVGLAIDLEPTGAGGDHVEGGVPVARDAKAPRRPQH
jgi:hypothetical protein